ncbi:flagellar brake protein [Cellvibrio sp.]|uniref:flagellar brake protein n=1 Tax=Cellvibrio sp. TaxID=1965322 RepID=UPI003964793E
MKFEDMKLIYGYPLQLQANNSAGQPERFSCRLIGCLPGRSILLSVPKLAGKLVRFRNGQKLVARLMVDNGIGIFASVVETQTADPYPILHISYPDSVSFKGIRGATRVAIDEPVKVMNLTVISDREIDGNVVDVSVTGARIETAIAFGEIGHKIQVTMNVAVANIHRDLALEGIIRSRGEPDQQSSGNLVAYGIEFIEPEEDKRLLLYAFVYAQIGSEEVIG